MCAWLLVQLSCLQASLDALTSIARSLQAAKGPGDDVRAVGSDIQAGEVVLPEGSVIGAAEVGLLATVGAAKLRVSFLLQRNPIGGSIDIASQMVGRSGPSTSHTRK